MARKKGLPCWRPAFLRVLRRTGNVTLAAERAGVDKSTVYLARKGDAGFAGKWAAAVETAGADEGKRAPRLCSGRADREAPELVVRVSKRHGAQLVKVSAGRWSTKREKVFLAALAHSGCVRSAARACGLSTNALRYRKRTYPDFATRWRAAEAEAGERVPALLAAAAIAALDPEIDDSDLPPVSISEALHICRMKGFGASAGGGRVAAREDQRVATNAEVREALTKRLAAFRQRIRARRNSKEGWSGDEEGG